MKEKALTYLRQARTLWESLSRTKKILLVVVTSGVLIGAMALATLSSQESYEYLFTDLSQADAAGIVSKLNELKIPHKIEANGSAVLVPKERVHEIRLQLAGMGLPRGGGVGFEIFDKSQFGSTEFEQQVNFRRALEGELSRTIATIGTVRSARVHLVLPEKSVFVLHRQTGSASVVLQLEPGRDFGRREVKAVVHLVASAVPGLSAQNVSVVSSDGMTLHRPRAAGQDAAGVDDPLAEHELEMARALESRVRELLERVVGAQHADVRVRLTLDTRVRERTEEHFNPAATALRSEHRTTEGTGSVLGEAGVPGARSNLPDDADSEDPEAAEDFADEEDFYLEADKQKGTRQSITRNWEVDRVTEKTKTPAGGIKRLSVAVLVDGVYDEVDGKTEFRVRNEKELDQLAGLVKSAIGFDASRGDVVSVESARFVGMEPAGETEPPLPKPMLPSWFRWYYAAIPAGLLLALTTALTLRAIRRRRKANTKRDDAPAVEGPDAVVQLDAAGERGELPEGARRRVDLDQLRNEAIELAERDPDTASVILREWLNSSKVPNPTLASAPSHVEG